MPMPEDGCETRIRFEKIRLLLATDWIMTAVTCEKQSVAFLLTAHNAIWCLDLGPDSINPWRLIGEGMATLLYSGAVILIDEGYLLIVSGTIFGEVIVWVCSHPASTQKWRVSTKKVLLGHHGSIFGVGISDSFQYHDQARRLLASCSDDRTIRIWDISDCDNDEFIDREQEYSNVETGFGVKRDQGLELSTTWAHLSRIWGVHFISRDSLGHTLPRLVSRGEDGVCQFWNLEFDDLFEISNCSKLTLEAVYYDRHHAGKNIWSIATGLGASTNKIYTGGADGQIISRTLPTMHNKSTKSIPFSNILTLTRSSAHALKQYLVFSNGTIIATTDQGELVKTHVDHLDEWVVVFKPLEKKSTTLCLNQACNLAFYCSGDGTLSAYNIQNSTHTEPLFKFASRVTWMQIVSVAIENDESTIIHLLLNLYGKIRPRLVTVLKGDAEQSAFIQTVDLPSDFVCTSSLYHPSRKLLICGSRAGALAVFRNINVDAKHISIGMITRHVHGSDAVTSIKALASSEDDESQPFHALTTGRDGTLAVHRLLYDRSGESLETIHRASPPFGPNIEGADIKASSENGQSLILYGFKSKDFVVWDETHQTNLLSVDCGGAHRSWSYSSGFNNGSVFVWTKAGTYNTIQKPHYNHQIIQRGGHGREIKALAVTPISYNTSIGKLIATGAEDTDIRLFEYRSGSMAQVSVLKGHTTGLQALRFSSCGNYLLSSGGIEEFIIWRLNRVPVFGIGAVVVGTLNKVEEDEDARIMGFDVVQQDADEPQSGSFIILMAYSNGKAKVFEFDHAQSGGLGHFTLLQKLVVGTLCLSQAHIMELPSSLSALTGATDGYLRVACLDSTSDRIFSHRVHQSNIAAMSVSKISPRACIVATGGDDNALGLSLLHVTSDGPAFETLLVPKAHAAALTAVTLIQCDYKHEHRVIYVLSGGNDQTIRLWRLTGLPLLDKGSLLNGMSNGQISLATLQFDKICERHIDVADVSSIETVGHEDHASGIEFEVLVVGVGMQSVKFEIEV